MSTFIAAVEATEQAQGNVWAGYVREYAVVASASAKGERLSTLAKEARDAGYKGRGTSTLEIYVKAHSLTVFEGFSEAWQAASADMPGVVYVHAALLAIREAHGTKAITEYTRDMHAAMEECETEEERAAVLDDAAATLASLYTRRPRKARPDKKSEKDDAGEETEETAEESKVTTVADLLKAASGPVTAALSAPSTEWTAEDIKAAEAIGIALARKLQELRKASAIAA